MKHPFHPLVSRISLVLLWALLLWQGWGFLSNHMEKIAGWSMVPAIFWVLWGIEAVFMLWWTSTEMSYRYLSVIPAVYIGWIILAAILVLFLTGFRIIALILAGIAALPLLIMGLFILASVGGKFR